MWGKETAEMLEPSYIPYSIFEHTYGFGGFHSLKLKENIYFICSACENEWFFKINEWGGLNLEPTHWVEGFKIGPYFHECSCGHKTTLHSKDFSTVEKIAVEREYNKSKRKIVIRPHPIYVGPVAKFLRRIFNWRNWK